MDVTLAVLADSANTTADGRLNIMGIFDHLQAATFPVSHPIAWLVLRLEAPRSEEGDLKRIQIWMMDEDRVLYELAGELVIPPPRAPGAVVMNQLLQLRGLPLPRPGEYAFHILVNGEEKRVVPLRAGLLAQQPPGG